MEFKFKIRNYRITNWISPKSNNNFGNQMLAKISDNKKFNIGDEIFFGSTDMNNVTLSSL